LLISAILEVQNLMDYGAFHHHLSMRLAAVTDRYVVLIFMWLLQKCRQLTLTTKRKFVMVGEVWNRQ